MRLGMDWLTRDTAADDVCTPERLSEEHRMIERTAVDFVAGEVAPAIPELDKKNWTLARDLIRKAGALDLIGVDTPEAYGGVGLDKAAAILVGDAFGDVASFAATFGAQNGLAIIPILCFGSEEQKKQYLPRITSGELVGAYCLSESGSGSDALSVRTRATKGPDGHWLLNGEKMWITNGGFADVFIVFAKVDGEKFSAFIVERGFEGVSTGKEEHKMGLHGSSTTAVILQNAKVPAANLLGEVGRGHKIAFNVLNYGRFKLTATCTGGARSAIAEAAAYAATRRQFGRPIAEFGAVRHKLAEMSLRLYAVESMLFRTTGLLDDRIGGSDDGSVLAASLEEFALEASMLKVAGSEMIDFVVDENVQIHGGNGFVTDYPAERRYRDARVNRIFEGTNEINRLLVPGTLLKRLAARKESAGAPGLQTRGANSGLKEVAVGLLELAAARPGAALERDQEIAMGLTDLMIDAFAAESAELRAAQAAASNHPLASVHADAATLIASDARGRVTTTASTILASILDGDALAEKLSWVARALHTTPATAIAARGRIADAVLSRKAYPFGAVS